MREGCTGSWVWVEGQGLVNEGEHGGRGLRGSPCIEKCVWAGGGGRKRQLKGSVGLGMKLAALPTSQPLHPLPPQPIAFSP